MVGSRGAPRGGWTPTAGRHRLPSRISAPRGTTPSTRTPPGTAAAPSGRSLRTTGASSSSARSAWGEGLNSTNKRDWRGATRTAMGTGSYPLAPRWTSSNAAPHASASASGPASSPRRAGMVLLVLLLLGDHGGGAARGSRRSRWSCVRPVPSRRRMAARDRRLASQPQLPLGDGRTGGQGPWRRLPGGPLDRPVQRPRAIRDFQSAPGMVRAG